MDTIKITPYNPLSSDERGATIEFPIERMGNSLFAYRKAGTLSGNHYHKGIENNKNPEILWVLHGELKLRYKRVEDDNWKEELVKGPSKVEIFPNIIHVLEGITDFCMLELNSLQQHINDTFKV